MNIQIQKIPTQQHYLNTNQFQYQLNKPQTNLNYYQNHHFKIQKTPTHHIPQSQYLSPNQKQQSKRQSNLDIQLNQIDALKKLYQSKRSNQSRQNRKSIQKIIVKSNQKHLLKPSLNPTKIKQEIYQKQAKYRNSLLHQNSKKNYNIQNSMQKGLKKQIQGQSYRTHFDIIQNKQSRISSSRYSGEEQIRYKAMQIQQMSKKLMKMQEESRQYKQRLEQSQMKNKSLNENLNKVISEKQKLQKLLKSLLYERQRQKLYKEKSKNNKVEGSKDMSPEKLSGIQDKKVLDLQKQNMNTMNDSKNVKNGKILQVKHNEDKKIKVQNILQKLKIRISRD